MLYFAILASSDWTPPALARDKLKQGMLLTYAGSGNAGYKDGLWYEAEFSFPAGEFDNVCE